MKRWMASALTPFSCFQKKTTYASKLSKQQKNKTTRVPFPHPWHPHPTTPNPLQLCASRTFRNHSNLLTTASTQLIMFFWCHHLDTLTRMFSATRTTTTTTEYIIPPPISIIFFGQLVPNTNCPVQYHVPFAHVCHSPRQALSGSYILILRNVHRAMQIRIPTVLPCGFSKKKCNTPASTVNFDSLVLHSRHLTESIETIVPSKNWT